MKEANIHTLVEEEQTSLSNLEWGGGGFNKTKLTIVERRGGRYLTAALLMKVNEAETQIVLRRFFLTITTLFIQNTVYSWHYLASDSLRRDALELTSLTYNVE